MKEIHREHRAILSTARFGPTCLASIVIAVAALSGCKSDKCEDLPAQAQIVVVLENSSTKDASTSEVKLIINGEQEVSRSFSKAAPSFVFKFEELDQPPRTLTINVTVKDKQDEVVGVGHLETTFSSDACNFFTVSVGPGGLFDAGTDGEVPDAGVDGALDGQGPDAGPYCGDGKKNENEDCDGNDLGGMSCASRGFDGGELGCSEQCGFDTKGCYKVLDETGFAISTASGDQHRPFVGFDGSNFFVVWGENHSGYGYDINGARVSTTGSVLDNPGIAISSGATTERDPSVAFDGSNYLVVWSDYRNGDAADIYGARVSTTGTVLDATGILISDAIEDQYSPFAAFDGTNFMVAWYDFRSVPISGVDIYSARLSKGGTLLDSVSIAVTTATGHQRPVSMAFDGFNYLLVWHDERNSPEGAIYGARVSKNGSLQDTSGIDISTNEGASYPMVAFDGINYLVVWEDYRSGATLDIYATRVSTAGIVLDSSGISISTDIGDQRQPWVDFNGTDYLVTWQDGRGGDYDIYGARVSTDGTVIDSSGIAICTVGGDQSRPSIAFDGANHLVVWQDYRNGSTADIYGARVNTLGHP